MFKEFDFFIVGRTEVVLEVRRVEGIDFGLVVFSRYVCSYRARIFFSRLLFL